MNNILLAVTGSVAAIKTRQLYEDLSQIGNVTILATEHGLYFMRRTPAEGPQSPLPVLDDSVEWPDEWMMGDPVPHIELRRNASVMVIAPLDANTLAKIALGISDNLVTSVARAWDFSKPMILCPAMNTQMWENEPTATYLAEMKKRGAFVVQPVEKRLACNDVGMGAMAPLDVIVRKVNDVTRWRFPLEHTPGMQDQCPGIPINHHPGAFGFHRKKNFHTGVDLYCLNGTRVHAAEAGTVVHIAQFTGPALGHTWWNDTWGIMIEGSSGVINYGEMVDPLLHESIRVGSKVARGQFLGYVKQVLFNDKWRPDIPGHSCAMLHLELYKHGTREFADWHDPAKNPSLLDPTQYLIGAENGPNRTLTWDNSEAKSAG